ncbi:MAG: hypothetical protein Q7T71_12400, partial [Herbiconiux sp.]|nr:hypothetical protein [Herbiconiux sp.]
MSADPHAEIRSPRSPRTASGGLAPGSATRRTPDEVVEWVSRIERIEPRVGESAGQTIVFDEADVLYVVLRGYVDVFTARINLLGQPHGRWREVCRLGAGSVVPGTAGRSGSRLVARIGEDTRLAMIRPVDVESTDNGLDRGRSGARKGLAAALDRTLGSLADAWLDSLPPREFAPIDGPVRLKTGQDARPVRDAAWVRVEEGAVRYGQHIAGTHASGSLLYVRRADWLVVESDCELEPVSTLDLVASSGIWHALAEHMTRLMDSADQRIAELEEEELGVLKQRAEASRAHVKAVADRIEHVFDDRGMVETSDVLRDDPVLGALRLVGRQIGLEVEAPLSGVGAGKVERQLARVLRANGASSREVRLSGRRWETDSCPIYVLRTDRRTAAALRAGGSSYL